MKKEFQNSKSMALIGMELQYIALLCRMSDIVFAWKHYLFLMVLVIAVVYVQPERDNARITSVIEFWTQILINDRVETITQRI